MQEAKKPVFTFLALYKESYVVVLKADPFLQPLSAFKPVWAV